MNPLRWLPCLAILLAIPAPAEEPRPQLQILNGTLVSVIAIELFGEDKWALGAGTLAVTFAILVFSEITPKIIGATHADRLAVILGYLLTPLLRLFYPAVWFINLFASGLIRLLHLHPERERGNTPTFTRRTAHPGSGILEYDSEKAPGYPFQPLRTEQHYRRRCHDPSR